MRTFILITAFLSLHTLIASASSQGKSCPDSKVVVDFAGPLTAHKKAADFDTANTFDFDEKGMTETAMTGQERIAAIQEKNKSSTPHCYFFLPVDPEQFGAATEITFTKSDFEFSAPHHGKEHFVSSYGCTKCFNNPSLFCNTADSKKLDKMLSKVFRVSCNDKLPGENSDSKEPAKSNQVVKKVSDPEIKSVPEKHGKQLPR